MAEWNDLHNYCTADEIRAEQWHADGICPEGCHLCEAELQDKEEESEQW